MAIDSWLTQLKIVIFHRKYDKYNWVNGSIFHKACAILTTYFEVLYHVISEAPHGSSSSIRSQKCLGSFEDTHVEGACWAGMAWLRKNGLGCCLDMANTSIYQHGINRTTIYNYIYAYICMCIYIYIYIRYFKIDICEFGVKRMGSISWYIPCIGG